MALASGGWFQQGNKRVFRVLMYGEGTYIGRTIPEGEAAAVPGSMAKALAEQGMDVPTIRLDSGDIVYGCECWWTALTEFEEHMRHVKGAIIERVSIHDDREETTQTYHKTVN